MLSWFTSLFANHHSFKNNNHKIINTYLQTSLPKKNQSVLDIEYLALDFETTGLNAKKDVILSVGYTLIRHGKIILKESGHHIIKINIHLPSESVVIHKITHARMKKGEHLHDVLEILLNKMIGRALLVHYAPIEKNFLNMALKRVYGVKLPLCIVDTLEIERRYLEHRHQSITPNQLRLFNLRKKYHLPRYPAHNALEDAIATAELFLAQINQRQRGRTVLRIKDI